MDELDELVWIHERVVHVRWEPDGYSVYLPSGASFWIRGDWLATTIPQAGDVLSSLVDHPAFPDSALGVPVLAATLNERLLFDTRQEQSHD